MMQQRVEQAVETAAVTDLPTARTGAGHTSLLEKCLGWGNLSHWTIRTAHDQS